jgi:hypothetical protein
MEGEKVDIILPTCWFGDKKFQIELKVTKREVREGRRHVKKRE